MKTFKGKAIYNPSGRAGEYSYWACNFYTGCSNGCEYCYCKKGILAGTMGHDKPQLKKCFKSEDEAKIYFINELYNHSDEIKEHGLFFSFSTDPLLPETKELTYFAMSQCMILDIPVKVLTKCIDWIADFDFAMFEGCESKIAFGFTLTGCDELEPGAASNESRCTAMHLLKVRGFKTFASIEPIIDLHSSALMINMVSSYCDLYKIGLCSGMQYERKHLNMFMDWISGHINNPVYFKDSFLKAAGLTRDELTSNCVGRDYNIFKSI